ncbi:hypothetical protein RHMOL_Rhmol03G0020200 [Rhododendron molle]|uniref:Uncharacterized protein n=1 Tax=Rhododendron molle TaxID=49168 RepID=A0ACC0PAS2_RHOML|nr:hypothetical protein RHMOL_Rhmol03G0020200 [Rhododendron molle]
MAANFKANFCVSDSKPNPPENNHHHQVHHNAASSSATTNKNAAHNILASSSATTSEDGHHGEALSLSTKMICNDLLLVDSAFAEASKYMDHVNVKINLAHQKFEELKISGGSQRDFDELRKAVAKLKLQIPSHGKIRSADSNPNRNRWPNINEAEDGITHFFYKEPDVEHTGDFDGLILEAFRELSLPLRIKEWKEELPLEEEVGNKIIDELIAKGFIEPVYQNCSLAPDSRRMSLSVRSTLYEKAEHRRFTSNDTLDLDLGFVCGGQYGHSCLINVGEAITPSGPETFENMNDVQSLCLGRWQSLATHHIELADTKILLGLKKLNRLTFLSLQGISMITELPTFIVELNDLKILDLRACHNLETIPDNVGLLENLTHLDMSECYFLEHMPKSLAQLSNLQVLEGFFIGDFNNNNKQSCTLHNLSRLSKLRKLNIYVSVKDFHRLWDFDDLKNFEGLQKLTISWGGCSLRGESLRFKKILENPSLGESRRKLIADSQATVAAFFATQAQGPLALPPRLQKLDLQCFPAVSLTTWLRPEEMKGLKKLYIRGGQLCDLGQSGNHQGEHWNVEILRLKYLEELEIDWREQRILFPKLIYLHQVECPKLTNFCCDQRGVWMDDKAIDTLVHSCRNSSDSVA